MKYSIVSLLAVVLVFASCAQDGSEKMTDGGFSYKLMPEGGGEKAQDGDYVFFHVDMLADETEQFNSRTTGQESMIQIKEQGNNNIITDAMQEVLKMSSVGDSLVLMVPTDSLKSLGFPPNDTTKMLYYNIRVTDVLDEASYTSRMDEEKAEADAKAVKVRERLPEVEKFVAETYKYIASGKGGENIKEGNSGIQYIIHEEGTGAELNPGDVATVHYYGVLKSNGKEFDNSWKRGQELQFQIGSGQVIKGWDIGVDLLRGGSKATLILPAAIGYGAQGSPPSIGPNEDLIFYIEVAESE